ncbi:MAG: hypothetical protein HC902_13385, partial [Calothrix sp. SM1_5_4]|nr:hypothetical protein [Calothrix sp. SM1_5_4]
QFLGLSDGRLYYKLEPGESLTCGSAGTIYRNHLRNAVLERFPQVDLTDASPVAVYGERA